MSTIGNQADVTVKVYVCANIKHTKSLCSKCPPCARMQAKCRSAIRGLIRKYIMCQEIIVSEKNISEVLNLDLDGK